MIKRSVVVQCSELSKLQYEINTAIYENTSSSDVKCISVQVIEHEINYIIILTFS